MSARRTERLLNLVIALRATRRGMRRSDIRAAVPQYAGSPSEAAFERMFERDKEDLRDIGVPILVVPADPVGGTEERYRVDAAAYELPPVRLSAAEVAVLGLAARVWQQAALAAPAARALTKLRAVGDDDEGSDALRALTDLVDPGVRTAEEAFSPLHEALRRRRAVRFAYRRADGQHATRTVEPWRLVLRAGSWYLVGRDVDRSAARVFRLARFAGEVELLAPGSAPAPPPEQVVAEALRVLTSPARPPQVRDSVAVLEVAPGRGGRLRAAAMRAGRPADGDRLEIPLAGDDAPAAGLVSAVAACGADARVVAPDRLRERVEDAWAAVVRAHTGPAEDPEVAGPAGPEGAAAPGEQPSPAHVPGATDRLSRLLAMVPYVLAREGVSLAELASHFEVTQRQVVRDLELLFVCGTPGHLPDDLIEADWEGGVVRIGNAEHLSRPLRLTGEEALALLLGLQLLADVPGPHDRAAVASATDTLAALAAGQDRLLQVLPDPRTRTSAGPVVEAALREGRRLHLHYLSAGRDVLTERDVDPVRLVHSSGRNYLEAWCHRAEGLRLFRLDRVVRAAVLDVPSDPRRVIRTERPAVGVPSGPEDVDVGLRLGAGARWVAEEYPVQPASARPVTAGGAAGEIGVETGEDTARETGGEADGAAYGQADGATGATHVVLRTSDPQRVLRLVLGLAGAAEVTSPAWLRREVARAAGTALAASRGPAGRDV